MSHVFIIGFMGAGKSTTGRMIADRLGMDFVDMDDRIEAEEGRSISEIFAQDGEEYFRDLESRLLVSLAGKSDSVVACGGGVILAHGNRALLSELGSVLYLKVTAGEALARIGTGGTRPLLAEGGSSMAGQLLKSRESLYESTADITVDTVGVSRQEVVEHAVTALGAVRS